MNGDNVSTQSLEESIRLRPENLMASNIPIIEDRLIASEDLSSLCYESFLISPLASHMFLEVLSNAVDNYEKSRRKGVYPGIIRVTIHENKKLITIENEGLPFSCDVVNGKYNPELALFTLLSSTNYDVTDITRTSAGRNGIGGSAVSLFTEFTTIDIVNATSKIYYSQNARDCLRIVEEPTIVRNIENITSSTKFSYQIHIPSVFKNSNIVEYSNQMIRLFAKICMDSSVSSNAIITFITPAITINYNFQQIKTYTDLVFNARNHGKDVPKCIEFSSPREFDTKIVIYDSPFSGFCMGYVNGIPNPKGGTHIDIVNHHLLQVLKKQPNFSKIAKVTPSLLLQHIVIFVVCRIPAIDVAFADGQKKEKLLAPKYKITFSKKDDDMIEQMDEWLMVQAIAELVSNKLYKDVDGKKTRFINVKDSFDAVLAGTKESYKCILNIVEGVSTINSVVKGTNSEFEGVYAVGGKILNVSKCNKATLDDNERTLKKVSSKKIAEFIKMMGLKIGIDYSKEKNFRTLRYHKIRLLTDEDVDGYHIQGLMFNMMRDIFPTLAKRKDFIVVGNTPLIRLIGLNKKYEKEYGDMGFYNVADYEKWRDDNPSITHKIKYFKGLGSNNDNDVINAFKAMKSTYYEYEGKMCDQFMSLAFDSGQENNRKMWISNHEKVKLSISNEKLSMSYFINYTLMLFFIELVARSIPCIVDGLKPSQRKILYVALSLPLSTKFIKSLAFVGKVMEQAQYHHGESSLYNAIAGMISSYMGLNNYPLLLGDSQFGTIASAFPSCSRYTECGNNQKQNSKFFHSDDDILLQCNFDGTLQIEPKYYIPVVPIFMLNGGSGIGVGWSTNYPPHHLDNIINWIKIFILRKNGKNVPYPTLIPWFKDYEGVVRRVTRRMIQDEDGIEIDEEEPTPHRDGYWVTEGKFVVSEKQNIVVVTRFPAGMTCENYCLKLDNKIKNYAENKKKLEYKKTVHSLPDKKTNTVKIVPHFILQGFENPNITTLGLRSKVSDTNIKLLDENGIVISFDNTENAMEYWCEFRYKMYKKRKQLQIEKIERIVSELQLKAKFISHASDSTIDTTKFRIMTSIEIKNLLDSYGFPQSYMDIPFSAITMESHNRLQEKVRQERIRLKYYVDSSIDRIWIDDLKELTIC